MVDGYRGKTEEEAEEAKDRGASDEIRANIVSPLHFGRLTISSIIQTFRNSLFQSISHIQ